MQRVHVNGKWLAQKLTGTQRYATEIVRAVIDSGNTELVVHVPADAEIPDWLYTPRVEIVPRGDLRNAVPMQAQQRKRGLLWRSAFLQLRKEICFRKLRVTDGFPAAVKRTVGFLRLPAPALSALP